MDKSDEIKRLIASFAEQATPERWEEIRAITGIGRLPEGTLQDLLKDHGFSVDDIVAMLLSGWILQSEELRRSEKRVEELEGLCAHQKLAIDSIVDQTARLRSLVTSILPNRAAVSSFDILKDIAVSVEETGTSETGGSRPPSPFG